MVGARTAEAPSGVKRRYQLDSGVGRLTPAERAARGKEARAEVPRDGHAVFDPPPGRPDPIGFLEEQGKARVPELVPVRYGRMMVSPFTYFRGARSGDRIAIAAYLGGSEVFDRAITQFAAAHADQNERDHAALVDAVASGRLAAERDL